MWFYCVQQRKAKEDAKTAKEAESKEYGRQLHTYLAEKAQQELEQYRKMQQQRQQRAVKLAELKAKDFVVRF